MRAFVPLRAAAKGKSSSKRVSSRVHLNVDARRLLNKRLQEVLEKEEEVPKSSPELHTINKSSTGQIYRSALDLIERKKTTPPPRTTAFYGSTSPNVIKEVVKSDPLDEISIPAPSGLKSLPKLAHGLRQVLFSPGIHTLKDLHDGSYNFSPFLEHIHSPDEIAYDAIQDYITSSKDEILHSLAKKHNIKYKGSTSSVSKFMAHLYYLFSDFKSVNYDALSYSMQLKAPTFSTYSTNPSAILLRKKEGTYSIDADNGDKKVASNKVLMDLGKSLERMLTMEPSEFEAKMLKKNNPAKMTEPEVYHYLKINEMLFRSQLDCHDPDLPGPKKSF